MLDRYATEADRLDLFTAGSAKRPPLRPLLPGEGGGPAKARVARERSCNEVKRAPTLFRGGRGPAEVPFLSTVRAACAASCLFPTASSC